MKVILGMVQTVNGMIADSDFSEEFTSWDSWKIWKTLAEKVGCVVWGRKTYDVVSKQKYKLFEQINARKIILSKNKETKLLPNFTLANSPHEAIAIASKLGFKEVLISGGGKINSSFMKEKLVDEIVLIIEPYVLGKGIGIFEIEDFESELKLTKVRKFRNGLIQLDYKVLK